MAVYNNSKHLRRALLKRVRQGSILLLGLSFNAIAQQEARFTTPDQSNVFAQQEARFTTPDQSNVFAQQEARFTTLDQSNGLRSGDVMCFQQDEKGFIWIGTKFGLNVYDGSNFDVLRFENTVPFISDISALQLGKEGEMWIGTTGDGLFLYRVSDRSLLRFSLATDIDSATTIHCLEYWNRFIWIGTDRGIFRIGEDLRPVPFRENGMGENITEMTIHNDHMAAGTQSGGLFMINRKGVCRQLNFQSHQVNALESLDSERLIIGTQYAGLFCLATNDSLGGTSCFNDLLDGNPPVINELLTDREGNLWVGTDGEGLFRFSSLQIDSAGIINYRFDSRKRNSIASNAIFSLFEDRSAHLWIGTIWKGMSILDLNDSNVEFIYSDITGEDPYPVLSVFAEGSELWIGTDGKGINIINPEKEILKRYNSNTKPAIDGGYVQEMFRDSEGIYWIGTFSSGLIRLDRSTGASRSYISNRDDPASISYNDVRKILEDEHSDLWIATWGGGLNKYNRETGLFTVYSDVNDAETLQLTKDITSICYSLDSSGIWAGTFGHGLHYFDPGTGTFSGTSIPEFERLKILTLLLDRQGLLWIGTWGNGLFVYDTKIMSQVFEGSFGQIRNSRITSIEEDKTGNKWFSSKNGIYKFDPVDSTLLKYGSFDLVSNKEFHINASCKDLEGNIYFGGLAGVIKISPGFEDQAESLAPPVITNIYLFNENLPTFSANEKSGFPSLKLAYNQNFITFSYSTPHFPVSDVSYRYRLRNFSDEWVVLQGDQVTFPKLPPGKYEFNVRSSLNNLNWSEPASMNLVIAQPYWKSWFAYLVYVSLFILFLYLFQKYTRDWEEMRSNLKLETLRRDQENELHTTKQRFFTNISHEIKTPVTLILGATNRLLGSGILSKGNQKEIDVLQNSSRHLLHLINELLDFRRLESGGIKLRVAEGDFQKYVKEIFLSFQSQAYSSNIDYRFISREEEMMLWFDRDQMEKVIYNLNSNAFKYTPSGGTVTVEVDQDDQYCYLKVTDSGTGIDEEQLAEIFKRFYQSENAAEIREHGFGLGLSIAKDIVKMHGGEIAALNNPGPGICIAIKLPKGNAHFPEELQIRDFKSSENIENYIADQSATTSPSGEDVLADQTVLIVEDNIQLLNYLEELFSGFMHVLTASDGEEGLRVANEHIPDIIVSDIMMPLMDGVSMTKVLKTSLQTSHIPVVLLTARTNLIYKKEGYDIGADDYINKPFNESILKSRVINILRNRMQFREKLFNEYISKPREELNISTPDQQFLSALTAVIEKNIDENDISAGLIATELGMSHSVVYKKIKGLTGMSLIEFIRDFKLKRAAILLSRYKLSITDVCFKVGFSDRRYFSKLFKNKYSVTPSEYLKRSDKH